MDSATSGQRASAGAAQTSGQRFTRWLRPLTGAMLILLLAQFLIGMLINFFVTPPAQHPGVNAPEYFSGVAQVVWWALGRGGLGLASHAGLGIILGLLSLVLLAAAIATRRRVWIIVTVLGWIGVFSAGFNGASFLNYGHDFSSLIMTIGFLLALIAYALGMYYTKPS